MSDAGNIFDIANETRRREALKDKGLIKDPVSPRPNPARAEAREAERLAEQDAQRRLNRRRRGAASITDRGAALGATSLLGDAGSLGSPAASGGTPSLLGY